MKRKFLTVLFFGLFSAFLFADDLKDGVYAEMNTNKGKILLQLEYEKTPMTVCNFVGLAEGMIQNSAKKLGTPYYDGLMFHRVIKNFMVQGGDPEGTGRGGPGYKFADEIDSSLKHTGPGILSMANAGAGTNGSQFFITHKATPWLDGKHTVFGRVIEGMKVVNTIVKEDKIETLKILRIGEKAKAFKADTATFDTLKKDRVKKAENQKMSANKVVEDKIASQWPKAIKTKSGLRYIVLKEGSGDNKPAKGSQVTAHYTGKLLSGKVFDSSVSRGKPIDFPVGIGRVISGWDEALLDMKKGEKRTLIIPPNLAYGPRGRPPVIPPNSTLVFDVELIEFKP